MSSEIDESGGSEPITLSDAAEQLGVHYMTAYRYVRTGRMAAHKRAGKWWVAPDALAAVLVEGTGIRRAPASAGEPRELLVGPFTDRLVAGDTAGCWDLITDALASGATPVEVHTRLLQAALVQVGEGWRHGHYTVADEHRATSTSYRLLGQMGPLFRHRGRRRGTIVLGAVAGDPHAMPTAMLADLLSDQRFDVIDLGANTPTDSFVGVATRCDDLVGIGLCVALDRLVPSAAEQIADLRDRLTDVFIVVGGPAVIAAPTSVFDKHADVVSMSTAQARDAFDQHAQRARSGAGAPSGA